MTNSSLNAEQLENYIKTKDVLFVDFWAEWCGPCKQFAKTFNKIAEEFLQITFANINIEKEGSLAELFNIRSIPHLMVFKKGILIYSEAGNLMESALKELVEQSLTIDVSGILID